LTTGRALITAMMYEGSDVNANNDVIAAATSTIFSDVQQNSVSK